jgi:hypothetical protein
MRAFHIVAVGLAAAGLAAAAIVPAAASSHSGSTIQFTTARLMQAKLSSTATVDTGTDDRGSRVTGTYEVHVNTSGPQPVVNAAFALGGGLLYVNATENNGSLSGTVTGGTGRFANATGEFAATGLTGAQGAVVILLSSG